VVLNPQTGEILALADAPGYDPNHPRLFPAEAWNSLAAASEFEPGPVFKLFPALAMAVSGDTAQFPISNSAPGFAGRVDPAELMKVLTALGFGQPTGIELPTEVTGDLPEANRLKSDTTQLESLLQGKGIGTSLLQLTQAAAVIASDGNVAAPHLVARLEQSGKAAREIRIAPKSVFNQDMVAVLRRRLSAGIPGGAFSTFSSNSTSSPDTAWCINGISAQSGTSGQPLGDTVLLALGWFPVDTPQVVIAVLVDRPFAGSASASTPCDLLQAIARQIKARKNRGEAARKDRSEVARNDRAAVLWPCAIHIVSGLAGLAEMTATRDHGSLSMEVNLLRRSPHPNPLLKEERERAKRRGR
jgi:cell division protein FtsI/penicillin-binding protein 2